MLVFICMGLRRQHFKMVFAFIHNPKIQTILRFIVDFLKHNPIHCTSYLAKTCIHWSELILWTVGLTVFLTGGLFHGMNLIKDYSSRNSAITSNINYMELQTLYPSVTLCPQEILNQTKLEEFKSLSNSYYVRLDNKTAVKIMTEVGICYTINNFLSEELYTKHWSDLQPYPENLKNRFTRTNTTFNFRNSFPLTEAIKHNIIGNITVYVHSPYEIPTIWTKSTLIMNYVTNTFKLTASLKEINYDEQFLKQATIENRRCRNQTESNLKVFPFSYSRNLCLMECRAHYIQDMCNCLPHFYSQTLWKDTNVCNMLGLNCFNKYADIFSKINANTKSSSFNCGHCPSNCFEQIVVVKISKTATSTTNGFSQINCVIEHPPLQAYVRSVMYTHLDYIVQVVLGRFTFMKVMVQYGAKYNEKFF